MIEQLEQAGTCAMKVRRRWNAPRGELRERISTPWVMPAIEAIVVRYGAETLFCTVGAGTTNSICDITVARVRWLERPRA